MGEVRWIEGLPDITQEDITAWVMPNILEEKAQKNKDKTYLIFGGGNSGTDEILEVNYEEANAMVNRVGNGLMRLGISKGDKVAILLPNSPFHLLLVRDAQDRRGVRCPKRPWRISATSGSTPAIGE